MPKPTSKDSAKANAYAKSLAGRPLPKALYDTIFAEAAGGPPEEVAAVASAFLNRMDEHGIDKALKGSSAYRLKSKQYKKAELGAFTPYEAKVYNQIADIVDQSSNKETRHPFYYFENVDAYGNPPWLSDTQGEGVKLGRQTFWERRNK